MEECDIEIIRRLAHQDQELRTLMEEHEGFERQLATLTTRSYLSPEEQVEKKRLQKLKLAGKDKIEQILSRYRP